MSGSFSPRVGDRVRERFELMAPLREGGPTQVFLAVDHQAGREVELLLFDPVCVQAETWTAFARAIGAAAAAKIPGLVLPRGVTRAAPVPPYCAADVQAALSLERLVERGPMPWRRALTLCERIAGIVERAHAATAVAHRALTPSRCVVTGRDEVRVLDYGVAELTSGAAEGSPYRAPEQQHGGGDLRSDVHAIGVMLCELITGQRAVDEPPRVDVIADVSGGVRELVDKALAADPGQRYADLGAMRAAMCSLLGIEFVAVETEAPPAPRATNEAPGAPPSLAGAEPPLHGGAKEAAQREKRDAAPTPVPPSASPPRPAPTPVRRTMPPPVPPSAPPPRPSPLPSTASAPLLLPPPAERTEVLVPNPLLQAAPAARAPRTSAQAPVAPPSDKTEVTPRRAVRGSPAAAVGARSGAPSRRVMAREEPSLEAAPLADSTVVVRSPGPSPRDRPPAPSSAATNVATRSTANRPIQPPAVSTFVGAGRVDSPVEARAPAESTLIFQAPGFPERPSDPDVTRIWRPPPDAAEAARSDVEPEPPPREQTVVLAPGPVVANAPRLAAAAQWPLRTKLLVVNVALAVVILVGVIVAT